jgi:hypothetical protein
MSKDKKDCDIFQQAQAKFDSKDVDSMDIEVDSMDSLQIHTGKRGPDVPTSERPVKIKKTILMTQNAPLNESLISDTVKDAILLSITKILKNKLKVQKFYDLEVIIECNVDCNMSLNEFNSIFINIGKIERQLDVIKKQARPREDVIMKSLSAIEVERIFGSINAPIVMSQKNKGKKIITATQNFTAKIVRAYITYSMSENLARFMFCCCAK